MSHLNYFKSKDNTTNIGCGKCYFKDRIRCFVWRWSKALNFSNDRVHRRYKIYLDLPAQVSFLWHAYICKHYLHQYVPFWINISQIPRNVIVFAWTSALVKIGLRRSLTDSRGGVRENSCEEAANFRRDRYVCQQYSTLNPVFSWLFFCKILKS